MPPIFLYRLKTQIDNLRAFNSELPDFVAARDLNSQWRMKISMVKTLCSKLFGETRVKYFARSLIGKPSWSELDPKFEFSFLNSLPSSDIAHKEQRLHPGAALKVKTRVVKKLCELAGGGSAADTRDFILRRLLKPTWLNVGDYISRLPSISKKSSLRSVAIQLVLSISKKVSIDDEQAAQFLLDAAEVLSSKTVDKSIKHENALKSLAAVYNNISTVDEEATESETDPLVDNNSELKSDSENFVGNNSKPLRTPRKRNNISNIHYAARIASCVSPHMSDKELRELGFEIHWRTKKRVINQLFEKENISPISWTRGRKKLDQKYQDSIKATFLDPENVSEGMNRPVKKAKGSDGLPLNAKEMNRSMTRIINKMPNVISKKERKAGKIGISDSSVRKYAPKLVPNLKKHRKRTGKCPHCHNFGVQCANFNQYNFKEFASLEEFSKKNPNDSNKFPSDEQIDLLKFPEKGPLEELTRARIKKTVFRMRILQDHFILWRAQFKFWQSLERDCPADAVLFCSDHMNPPVVGKGGKIQFNDTPHEYRTKTCFGHCIGTRGINGKVRWNYTVLFSDNVDHRSQAVIQMEKFIWSKPWAKDLIRGKTRAFHTHDNANTFTSKEILWWSTIGFAYRFPTIRESSYTPAGKCHGKSICDKMFQKISGWVESAEDRCYNIEDLAKVCQDGQKEANQSKQRRTGEEMTIFRAYTYKFVTPSKNKDIVDLCGIHSTGAVTYRKDDETVTNHVLPQNIAIRKGIVIPTSTIKQLPRKAKDLEMRRNTEDCIVTEYNYLLMQNEQKKTKSWLREIN